MNAFEVGQRARSLIGIERYDEAGEELSRGLIADPENYDLLCLMAEVQRLQGRLELADNYIKHAIATKPQWSHAYRIYSVILREGLRRHDSLAAAKEAVRIDPSSPDCWQTLSAAQLQVFDVAGARASAVMIRSLAPHWHVGHQMLGQIAMAEANHAEAEEHFRRALALNPTSYIGMNNLGVAQLEQKRNTEAIRTFESAVRLSPGARLARTNLSFAVGNALPKLGISLAVMWLVLYGLQFVGVIVEVNWFVYVGLGVAILVALSLLGWRWVQYRRISATARKYYEIADQNGIVDRKQRATYGVVYVTGQICIVLIWTYLGWWSDTMMMFLFIVGLIVWFRAAVWLAELWIARLDRQNL